MELQQLIDEMRARYDDCFNDPAAEADLTHVQAAVGPLPSDVLALYRDHDGSVTPPSRGDASLPGRLMPIQEVIETQAALDEFFSDRPQLGDVAWLWTDDNSNYAGVYTSGLLRNWLIKLDHEEPDPSPAWRSVPGFLRRLLDSAPGTAPDGEEAIDLVMVPREVPATADDASHVEADRELVQRLRQELARASDENLRRMLTTCIICLTPVADTNEVLEFLAVDDIWIPETAIRLLELREYRGSIAAIERLAREGRINGDSAAMRLLVRMNTPESDVALSRLSQDLAGQKLRILQQWMKGRGRLQPPWPY